jgi:pimeloyl-ACP methyl ester carboxylesterase
MTDYKYAWLDSGRLHYQIRGDGPLLVLIHAGVADLRMWDGQMEAFAQAFTVLRYDVRGWGRSPCPPGVYSDHDDLRALLDALGFYRAHLVGCSNGGRIALDFALAYPEQVNRLALVGTGLEGFVFEDGEVERLNQAAETAYAQGDLEAAAGLASQLWLAGPSRPLAEVASSARDQMRRMLMDLFALPEDAGERQPLTPPAIERLEQVAAQTLLLVGELDIAEMHAIADLLAASLPEVRRELLTGAAHLPNLEDPVLFNRLILNFLTEGISRS